MSVCASNIFKHYDFANWFAGMWVAIINGGSDGVIAGGVLNVVDPKDFNLTQSKFWVAIAVMFAASAGKSFFLYLKQRPLPQAIEQESTKTTTKSSGTVTVETVKTSIPVSLPDPPKPDAPTR